MIHICFFDPVAATLHSSSFPDEKKARKHMISFNWHLDIGYLHEGMESKYRKELPGRLIISPA